jgi:hypothetical protein
VNPVAWLARYRVQGEPLRSERRVELLVLSLAVLLLALALYYAVRLVTLAPPPAVMPGADSLGVTAVEGAGPVTDAQRAAMLQRPLFWSSRRPVESAETAEAAPAEDPKSGNIDNVILLGVFGEGSSAGIIARVGGRQQRVTVGESVEGWTLDAVALQHAVFSRSGESREVPLQKSAPPRARAAKTERLR